MQMEHCCYEEIYSCFIYLYVNVTKLQLSPSNNCTYFMERYLLYRVNNNSLEQACNLFLMQMILYKYFLKVYQSQALF